MAVPYTFGSATTSIPLSQLDSNFATTITLGNTAIQLGNTVTTLNNMTLTTPVLGTPASGTLTNCTGLPNAGLVNSSVTVGSTSIALGATATTVAGLTSLATNTLTSASATALTLQSAGTTAITVDTSQNVGIGTTSPTTYGDGNTRLAVISPTSGTNDINIRWGTNAVKGILFCNDVSGAGIGIGSTTSAYLGFLSNGSERMRITSGGNLLLGTTTSVGLLTMIQTTTEGNTMQYVSGAGSGDYALNAMNSGGQNNAAAGIKMGKNSSTSRSINAGGTINASGADYAEYMVKAGSFTVAKGDVVGINAQGKLTNVFADAIAFVVKSTDPSYVGGDVWGNEESLGLTYPKYLADDATDAEKSKYASDKSAFETALEVARQTVDRIAFSGQVPVNVTGATAGQYIIPVNDNGAIKGQAVSNPTFEQYQIAVGKVIAIESDGRAKIIVKVA